MRESAIEHRLKQAVEKWIPDAMCLKFESPGYTGVPDRLILMPGGVAVFVELKAPGRKERPRQRYVQDLLRQRGFRVYSSVDSYAKIDKIVEELCNLSLIHTSSTV